MYVSTGTNNMLINQLGFLKALLFWDWGSIVLISSKMKLIYSWGFMGESLG